MCEQFKVPTSICDKCGLKEYDYEFGGCDCPSDRTVSIMKGLDC